MANITYKTVLAEAIRGYNAIQTAINNNKAPTYTKRDGTISNTGVPAITLSGNDVSGALTANELASAINNLAMIKKSDGTYVNGTVTYRGSAAGTVTPSFSQNGNVITATFSKTLSEGYYTGGTISNSTNNSFTIPAASLTATPAATVTVKDGSADNTTILTTNSPSSYYTVTIDPSVDVTGSAGYATTTSGITKESGTTLTRYIAKGSVSSSATIIDTTITAGTKGITFIDKPSSGTAESDYFTLKPYATASSSMTLTKGYIESKGTESSTSSATSKREYYITAAKPTTNTNSATNGTITPSIGGKITDISTTTKPSSGADGTDYWTIDPNASITSNSLAIATVTVCAGYTKGFTVSPIANVTPNIIAGENRYILAAKTSISKNDATNGTITPSIGGKITDISTTTKPSGTDGTDYWTIDPGASITEQPRAAATVTISSGFLKDELTLHPDTDVTPNIAGGTNRYITKGTLASAGSNEATGSGTYASYTTLTPDAVPAEGYLILNAGYYKNSKISLASLIPDDSAKENAGASHILEGYEAYSPDGKKLVGTMKEITPEFRADATSSTTITEVRSRSASSNSSGNMGAAINYSSSSEQLLGDCYVTISATGSGGSSAVTYSKAAVGYVSQSAGVVAMNEFSTTSNDTNYIPADNTSTIAANNVTVSSSATITPVSNPDRSTYTTGDMGPAVNYSSATSAQLLGDCYVTISATAKGSATAGADKTLSVKDKYMLNNVTIKSAGAQETTGTGDTAYIPADNTTSVTAGTGTVNKSSTITAISSRSTSNTKGDMGPAINYDTTTNAGEYYVTVTATAKASYSTGGTSTLSIKDKYMLNNITVLPSPSIGETSVTDTNYIKATATSTNTVEPGLIKGNVSSPTVGSATTFDENGIETAGSKFSEVTATARVSANTTGVTLTCKDTYMLNNYKVTTTAKNGDLISGRASIHTDATGSTVDSYLASAYLRLMGSTYTEITDDNGEGTV